VKKSTQNNVFTSVIEEVFGGASGGGSGSFTYAQQTGAMSWNNRPSPAHRASTSDSLGYNIKDIAEEDEVAHEAPKVKPFPLDNIDELLVDAYLALCATNEQLKMCIKSNGAINTEDNKEAKKTLKKQYTKIEQLKEEIKKVSSQIDIVVF